MTIPGEIQTGIGQHAKGRRFLGGGRRAAVGGVGSGQPAGGVDLFDAPGAWGGTLELRVVRGADERTVHVVITPEIEGQ